MNLKKLFSKKDIIPQCSAVIVAAGESTRMGFDKLKAGLCGVPVLVRTLKVFENSQYVNEIVVVTKNESIEAVAKLCVDNGITKIKAVVSGGSTRSESSLAGVLSVSSGATLIAIHDAARPLITEDVITRTITAASEHLAAVPVIPSRDTVKIVENGVITEDLDRNTTCRVQTPQVFDADVIKGALTYVVTAGIEVTDDCSAAEIMGAKVFAVEGDENNIKLTSPCDMKIAEAIINYGEKT